MNKLYKQLPRQIKLYKCVFLLLFMAGMQANAQSFLQKGLKAKYYNKADFLDSVFTRRDASINFNWKNTFPIEAINNSDFSVRWLGYLVPKYSEKYTFYVTATGSCSLWINDKLVVTNDHPNKTVSGSMVLTKGIQYNIRLDYVNHATPSYCKLQLESKSQVKEIIPENNLIPENAGLPPVRVVTNVIGRDPYVMLGPDHNYYMVQTSCYLDGKLSHQNAWDHNDGLHLWKSKNLYDWTDEGLIWSIEKNGTWQKKYDAKGRRPLWAPEIHYIKSKKNWYVVYSMGTFNPIGIKTGLFKSKTGKPEGPYEDVVEGPIIDGIDGSLFEEDNGDVYFLHDNCQIAKMNKEMTGFVEPFRQLKTTEGKLVGFEGPGIIKLNHKYYLFSAQGNNDMEKSTYDLSIAVADRIYGPYTKSWLALRHGGHGSLFLDKKGDLWTSMFGSDDLSDVYITPTITRMALEHNGKILPLRGNARAKVIVPFAGTEAVKWKYTNTKPAANWNKNGFDDSAWAEGKGGFGKDGNTIWTSADIWIRKNFNPGKMSGQELENMLLYISYNDGVEVYINGIEAARMQGFNKYSLKKISAAAKASIKSNQNNSLAIHCHKQSADQFVDAGLITWTNK